MYKSKHVGTCLFVSVAVRQFACLFKLSYFLSICRLNDYALDWQYIGVYIGRPWKIIHIDSNAQA